MRIRKRKSKRLRKNLRHGMSSMDAVFALATVLPMAALLYLIAQVSLGNLYHVISIVVGYPYL